ncbi:MAG TPA: DUF484 family protein [Methylomirabilota bacterium]|nr:DUF484 family protein [Methylomirabilota bacterium]
MARSTSNRPESKRNPEPTPAQVTAYLRRHPDFLIRHPDALDGLKPPMKSRGDGVVDLQHFMVERLRGEIQRLRSEQDDLLAVSRDNLSTQGRVHKAVLALLGAPSFEHLIEVVTTDFAVLLDVDVVSLCIEGTDGPLPRVGMGGVHLLEPGTVDRLLGQKRNVMLRADADPEESVFAGAASLVRSDALVRLAVGSTTPAGILAFGTRHPGFFNGNQGTELLTFLARVLEHCIRGWLDLPE